MSKERFAVLLACLRFDNLENRIMRRLSDKAAAISEIFYRFLRNCQTAYIIGTYMCTNEILVGFQRRHTFKLYLPSKLPEQNTFLIGIG